MSVDVHIGEVGEIALDLDCRSWAPAPAPPPGLDLEAHEQRQLHPLRQSLLGTWTGEDGDTRPFIDGVTFDSVRLEDAFPSSAVVALFHAVSHHGVQFAVPGTCMTTSATRSHPEYADIGRWRTSRPRWVRPARASGLRARRGRHRLVLTPGR